MNNNSNLANKNRYTVNTLENNWNEERYDAKYVREIKPITSVIIIFLSIFFLI